MSTFSREKQGRIENCYLVKAVLMLSVVLCHSVSFWGGGWFKAYTPYETLPVMRILSNWTGSFHVYGFTLVSGYLFYYLRNDLGKYRKYSGFLVKKIKRLIIPYCFVCMIWVIPITAFYFKYSFKDIFVNYILGINAGQLWFLLSLFWCFAVGWLLLEYIKADHIYILVAVGLYICGYFGRSRFPDIFSIFRGFQFVILFVTGYLMRKNDSKFNHNFILVGTLLLHIILFVGKQTIRMPYFAQAFYDLSLHTVSAVAVFEGIQFVSNKVNSESSLLDVVIKNSMPVYLFHQQWIYFVISIFNGKVNPWLIAMFSFVISISGSILMGTIFRNNRITAFFIGEKYHHE